MSDVGLKVPVSRLADLVKIGLTDDEVVRLTGEVGRFDANITPSLDKEVALAQAPDREGDFFRVQSSLRERPSEPSAPDTSAGPNQTTSAGPK